MYTQVHHYRNHLHKITHVLQAQAVMLRNLKDRASDGYYKLILSHSRDILVDIGTTLCSKLQKPLDRNVLHQGYNANRFQVAVTNSSYELVVVRLGSTPLAFRFKLQHLLPLPGLTAPVQSDTLAQPALFY